MEGLGNELADAGVEQAIGKGVRAGNQQQRGHGYAGVNSGGLDLANGVQASRIGRAMRLESAAYVFVISCDRHIHLHPPAVARNQAIQVAVAHDVGAAGLHHQLGLVAALGHCPQQAAGKLQLPFHGLVGVGNAAHIDELAVQRPRPAFPQQLHGVLLDVDPLAPRIPPLNIAAEKGSIAVGAAKRAAAVRVQSEVIGVHKPCRFVQNLACGSVFDCGFAYSVGLYDRQK